ncbi:MAG: hypothetical protein PHH54_05910 [Candidatus Nanoarchaeia archaeon]|nr:hypothetical protein [Candidatus Nanoarchaeia archaeon]MDD5741489.1 hypothetical protein [Candidatus Nanoarchaeia archaeon]
MFYFKHPKRRRVGNLDYRLDPETTGKWVVYGNRSYIGKLWKKTREHVKTGVLYEIKFTRCSRGNYALLVYADKETKDRFYEFLRDLELDPIWISNLYTRRIRKINGLLKKVSFGF